MKRALILVLAVCLLVPASAMAQRWAFGEDEVPTLYAVGIMGSAVPDIDGDLSEWATYPDWNVWTFADNFIDNSFGTVKDLNSLDFTGKLAWHPTTNMIYFAFDVFDDVHVQQSAKGECVYWSQDDLEWYIDSDMSGGSYNGNEPEGTARCAPAQQLAMLVGGVGDDVCTCSASKWSLEPPYMYLKGTVTEDATGSQTTYEVATVMWDFLDETPDASTMHQLAEGGMFGASWDIDDQDVSGGGQSTAWYTTSQTALYREADGLNSVVVSPLEWTVAGGVTAVESGSWGAIKGTFSE